MASRCSLKVPEVTVPHFETEAVANALEMSQIPAAELEKLLRVNARIAAENRVRFHDFCSEDNHPMPAIGAYTGAVFKRILPKEFTADDFRYAQNHLRITLFSMGCSARWMESSLIVWRVMYDCPKKAGFPCSIIGNRC